MEELVQVQAEEVVLMTLDSITQQFGHICFVGNCCCPLTSTNKSVSIACVKHNQDLEDVVETVEVIVQAFREEFEVSLLAVYAKGLEVSFFL